jgi:hypothetical protein
LFALPPSLAFTRMHLRANAKAPLFCPKDPNSEVDTGKEKIPVVIRKALLDKELEQEEVIKEMKESPAEPIAPETVNEDDTNEVQGPVPETITEEDDDEGQEPVHGKDHG